MRTVCGLDIHKDSIFMCILDEQGKKVKGSLVFPPRDQGTVRQLHLYGG